jgi:hypothetical protein
MKMMKPILPSLSILLFLSLLSFHSARADQLCEYYSCETSISSATSSSSSGSGSSTGTSNGTTSNATSTGNTSVSFATSVTVSTSTVQTPTTSAWLNPVKNQSGNGCGDTQSNFAGDPLLSGPTDCTSGSGVSTQPTIFNSATNTTSQLSANGTTGVATSTAK